MKLLSKDSDLSFLQSEFSDYEFSLFVSNDTSNYMSCFVCLMSKKNDVVNNWEIIQNLISVYYQASSELSRWNVYIVYICQEKREEWDKYLIENDIYHARKVIVDNLKELPNLGVIEEILSNYLLGKDLEIQDTKINSEIELGSNFDKLVKSVPLEITKNAKDKRINIINKLIKEISENEN